ncbi:MAG: hypothetical protein U1F83_15880 [Verrucomicrobiota bacterium]
MGLIFVFGNRQPATAAWATPPPSSSPPGQVQALADPTLFALPHSHGFAAASWLKLPRVEFAPFRWTEPLQLMNPPVAKLGNAFLHYAQTTAIPRPELATLSPPELTPLEVPVQAAALKQRSAARVNGALAKRRWLNAPALLRSWPAADFLTNSVVQVLAATDGQIISAALLPPGSGSKPADQQALELARSARFAPVPRTGEKLTVGTLVFEWCTVPLADTNAPAAKP